MLPQEEGLTLLNPLAHVTLQGQAPSPIMLPMPVFLLDLLYIPAAILYLPILLYQMIALGKNRRGWAERFGAIRHRSGTRPRIWIHAVSLGEVNATHTLVSEIRRRLPDYEIAVSATTDTGYAAACRLYPDCLVFRYPLDFSWVVRRVLRRIRPSAIILMELEVWPNLVSLATRRRIALCIANGRITEERSMRRFRKPIIRLLARSMFSRITWTAAQDETYAARFIELGVPADCVHVVGSLKYDTAVVADRVDGADALADAMGIAPHAPLVVAGSTGPGEEEMVLEAWGALCADHPHTQLAIIPRKPERFAEVAKLIESRGYVCRRRSRCPDGSPPADSEPNGPRSPSGASAEQVVFLGDTMGELRKFYSLAGAVFVGRSLVSLGGSDVMEVAGLAKPMCFGPHMDNFSDAAEKLLAADAAIQIPSPGELSMALGRLLSNPLEASDIGRRAQQVVLANTGATRKTIDLLCGALGASATTH